MSASDPLKRTFGPRGVAPAAEPSGGPGDDPARRRSLEIIRCSYRPQDADFYCWKFGVWYNLMDCCYRHDQRTYEGCIDCGQGHSNLRQNRARYLVHRPRRGTAWGP